MGNMQLYRKILALFADGQRAYEKKELDKALNYFNETLKKLPSLGQARIMRALVYYDMGEKKLAQEEAAKALKDINPPAPEAYINYGVICRGNGLMDKAEEAFRKALELAPDNALARTNLANIYLAAGRMEEARKISAELAPSAENILHFINLARISLARNELESARSCIRKAEDIDPKNSDVLLLKAKLASDGHDDAEAFASALEALKSSAGLLNGWVILRNMKTEKKQTGDLEKLLHDVAQRKISSSRITALAVALCRFNLIWGPLPRLETSLSELLAGPIDDVFDVSSCFDLLGSHIPQTGHKNAAEATWKKIFGNIRADKPALPPLEGGRKLKVAFLSSDFHRHATSYLMIGLFEKLPKDKIEWFAYSNSFDDLSDMRKRLFAAFDHFVNVGSLDANEINERVRRDGIDILVDLKGMTFDTRAGVLAYKPAPIIIEWIGMPGTLGAPGIADYMLGDKWTMPAWLADGFSEKIIQLPRSYQPNDDRLPDYTLAGSRADHGLPENKFVFCCFNQYYKFSPETFRMWGEILRRVPNSVLWLMTPPTDWARQRLYAAMKAHGVEPERFVFAGWADQDRHIARLSNADLILDTLPYNAHTTCSDALRAGVPVATLPGETFAGRVAASILDTAGLAEWIARDEEEYIAKAVEYATLDPQKREKTRQKVYDTYLQSPMRDNEGLGKLLESLFLALAQREIAGQPPAAMRLTEDGGLEPLEEGSEEGETPKPENMRHNLKPEPTDEIINEDITDKNEAVPEYEIEELAVFIDELPEAETKIPTMENIALGDGRLPLVTDIGAAPIDGKPLWHEAFIRGRVRILGFEPNPEMFAKIAEVPNQETRPYAVGDGQNHQYHFCKIPGMNGFLEPDISYLREFSGFEGWSEVVKTEDMATTRLDDIPEALDTALLKIDVQGNELLILKNAEHVLSRAVMLLLELSPTPIYKGEPSMARTCLWLEEHGWMIHEIGSIKRWALRCDGPDLKPTRPGRRILQADFIFVPDLRRWDELSLERLGELAFLAHEVLRDKDLAARALMEMDKRDGGDRLARYRKPG